MSSIRTTRATATIAALMTTIALGQDLIHDHQKLRSTSQWRPNSFLRRFAAGE
jgi:hypothetical protein